MKRDQIDFGHYKDSQTNFLKFLSRCGKSYHFLKIVLLDIQNIPHFLISLLEPL